MTAMSKEEMKETIQEAIRSELGSLFVEREQHFLDHKFICDFRSGIEKVQGLSCKIVTYSAWSVIGGAIVWSTRHWLYEILGGKK